MSDENWGQCKSCKMWQIEPKAAIAEETMGLCVAEELETYRLRVSGDSGCSLYAQGRVKRAEGSSDVPPKDVVTQ